MDTIAQDFRYGLRQLLRQRGSSIVAILTLALGIGASTAIFSVVDATMLRPLPYPHPEQLVSVYPEETRPDGTISRATASMEDLRFWQQADDVFSQVAGWGSAFRGRIVEGPEPERIQVVSFTEDYLPMHGVTPVLGRGFSRADTEPNAPLVALLGYGYWRSHFGDRDVLGETMRLDADIATIVGVLPSWFNAEAPVSMPLRVPPTEFGRRGTGRVSVYARLRDGVTIEQARERIAVRMTGWAPSGGGARPPEGPARARISSRLDAQIAASRTTVNVLAAAVGLILLIACVNVAGLLLARGAARQSELAVRASMGAGRWRLVRQLLTESVALAVPGAALGVLLAWLSLDAIVANLPMSLPSNSPVTVSLTVLAATGALLVPIVLLFGLAPAIRLSRVRLGAVLARGGRQRVSSLSRRGSQVLIAMEVALAVVLVAGAGLMIRSFARITEVDLGFNPHGLLIMPVLPLDRTPAVHKEYYTALLHRLRTIPGVVSAGLVDNFSLGGVTTFTSVLVGGEDKPVTVFRTEPGYFETIGATLKAGRWPTDADYASGFRGVVISETAARQMFTDGSALNREFVAVGSDRRPWAVIGVVADLRQRGPLVSDVRFAAQVFYPLEPTEYDLTTAMTIVMRVSGAPAGLPAELRRVAQLIGPRVLVERFRTGEELFGDEVLTPRRRMVLLGLLGGLGLILALVGVFGMTAYSVARRTAEIGVRLAFGARPGQVVGTMLRDSAVPVAIGTAAGVGAAVLATRLIESFLFQTAPTDPLTLASVAVTLAITGCLAAIMPALRAARIDPASSLRAE
jgi:putative ABC transport system permease protein